MRINELLARAVLAGGGFLAASSALAQPAAGCPGSAGYTLPSAWTTSQNGSARTSVNASETCLTSASLAANAPAYQRNLSTLCSYGYSLPTVINGRVYVPSFDDGVRVYDNWE